MALQSGEKLNLNTMGLDSFKWSLNSFTFVNNGLSVKYQQGFRDFVVVVVVINTK